MRRCLAFSVAARNRTLPSCRTSSLRWSCASPPFPLPSSLIPYVVGTSHVMPVPSSISKPSPHPCHGQPGVPHLQHLRHPPPLAGAPSPGTFPRTACCCFTSTCPVCLLPSHERDVLPSSSTSLLLHCCVCPHLHAPWLPASARLRVDHLLAISLINDELLFQNSLP